MTRTNKPTSAMTSSDAGPRYLVPLVLVATALALRFVPGWVAPFTMVHFIGLGLGGALGVLGLLVWWTLSRRIPKRDRWLGLAFGALQTAGAGWSSGFSDLGFWWTVIAAILAIAGVSAMVGTWIHTRPSERRQHD